MGNDQREHHVIGPSVESCVFLEKKKINLTLVIKLSPIDLLVHT